jgi:integrase
MPAISIARFKDKVVANYEGRGCAPSTVRQVRQVLRELMELKTKHGKPLVAKTSDLTDEAIGAWKKAFPDRTPVTLKSHLRCLSSLCTRAKKSGWLKLDPFDVDAIADWVREDCRPSAPKRQWSRSPDDIRRVFALATREADAGGCGADRLRTDESAWEAERLRAYIFTLFLLGARPAEIQRLSVDDFSPRFLTITIQAKWIPLRGGRRIWWKPKTVGSAATLPIGDQLSEVLKRWIRLSGSDWLFPGKKLIGPWTTGGPGVRPLDQVKALGERAGVHDLCQKSARKGIGAHGKLIGLGALERKGFFRHEDEETSEGYDDEKVDSMRPAAGKIESFYLFGT